MKKQIISLSAIAALGFATTSFASVVQPGEAGTEPAAIIAPLTYNGTTVGGPTFNRPLANGNAAPTSLSGVGTAVPFDFVMFTIATTGTYTFLSTSTTTGYDNYTVLYSGNFVPTAPLSGVLIANDDLTSTTTSGFSYALTAGSTYSFVTTGFSNTSAGSFTDSITLAAVPEPGTWVMIGASVVGLAGAQRFRRRAS